MIGWLCDIFCFIKTAKSANEQRKNGWEQTLLLNPPTMLQIGFNDFIDESILSLEPRPFIKLLNI